MSVAEEDSGPEEGMASPPWPIGACRESQLTDEYPHLGSREDIGNPLACSHNCPFESNVCKTSSFHKHQE